MRDSNQWEGGIQYVVLLVIVLHEIASLDTGVALHFTKNLYPIVRLISVVRGESS